MGWEIASVGAAGVTNLLHQRIAQRLWNLLRERKLLALACPSMLLVQLPRATV